MPFASTGSAAAPVRSPSLSRGAALCASTGSATVPTFPELVEGLIHVKLCSRREGFVPRGCRGSLPCASTGSASVPVRSSRACRRDVSRETPRPRRPAFAPRARRGEAASDRLPLHIAVRATDCPHPSGARDRWAPDARHARGMAYVYILQCSDGTYYTGSTVRDPAQREWEHNHDCGWGANYTSKRRPVILVYTEHFESIEEAYQRERQLHGWGHTKKAALIAGRIEDLKAASRAKGRRE